MKLLVKPAAALLIVMALLALISSVIPVPSNMKLGELNGPNQVLRFVVPASRNLLYRDRGYDILLAGPIGGNRFSAVGKLIDSNGSEVSRINVSTTTVRTSWIVAQGFDGYLAARDIKLEPGAAYTLELQSLDPAHDISVWITHFNLEKSK